MLVNIVPPTNDFAALASYLVHGKERPTSHDRVAWIMTQNLPTEDPMIAAKYMTATAAQSRRCQNAAYHAMISWAPDEKPSPEIMQEIARKTLELAGLAEHQALIMGHGDKPHAHLHMLINRVHPTTGRAWAASHDYRRFDAIMRQLSEEHGFQYVPGHAFNPELTDELRTKPDKPATWAAKRGAGTNRTQWSKKSSREFGATISERLDRAATWDDLEAAFAEDGLTLEAKGGGLVAGTRTSYTKLSALGLSTTAKGFEKRFGRSYARHRPRTSPSPAHVFMVDAIDIARAIGTRADLRKAVQEAVGARKARLARAPLMEQLMAELRELLKASTSLTPARSKPCPTKKRNLPSLLRSRD